MRALTTQEEDLVRWASEGVTYREMGARLGFPRQKIHRMLVKLIAAGVPVAFAREVRKETITARDKEIIQWTSEGLTYKEMGAKLGFSRQRVKQLVDRLIALKAMDRSPLGTRKVLEAKAIAYMPRSQRTMVKAALASGVEPRVVEALRAFLRNKKSNCKQRGVVFDLTFEDLLPLPVVCPALGIPISLFATNRDNAYSLDQIVPGGGYTKDNVVAVSYKANRIKSDASPREIAMVARFYMMREQQHSREITATNL